MDAAEHVYGDDPKHGPRDAKTNLAGVDYFFVGNGLIQAAVQVCTSGEGTPVGLLVLHPTELHPKRRALTFDARRGLTGTALQLHLGGRVLAAVGAEVDARWTEVGGVPAVEVAWEADSLRVTETFLCRDRRSPMLTRVVRVQKSSPGKLCVTLRTGPENEPLERPVELMAEDAPKGNASTDIAPACRASAGVSSDAVAVLEYELAGSGDDCRVVARWADVANVADVAGAMGATDERLEAAGYWERCAALTCSSPTLTHLFGAARNQLPAVVTNAGMMDGGIWQYNLEWVRDQSCAAAALAALGLADAARTMLDRMLTEFVSSEGDCVDSGRRRAPAEVELDQNGYLAAALETYVAWTGDVEIARRHWPRVAALVEFPLRVVFRHEPSGLLHNRREYWERHDVHGIEEGLELTQQLYVAVGLESAARLARLLGQPEQAARWSGESQRIRAAMLEDARYGLVERGRFIKRRGVHGAVQETITPVTVADLPPGVPLAGDEPHYLDPDTAVALPIALELVAPRGELARNTLADVERLWNQRWEHGGYGRYHVSSEPDSPGPWPFATLFVARAYFEAGDDEKVWRVLDWLRSVPGGRAGAWFEFYGPRPVPPCPQVGVIPWTWAEVVTLFIHHMLGVRPGHAELVLRPRLLAGLEEMDARLWLRGHKLRLIVRRARAGESPKIVVAGRTHPHDPAGVRLPLPDRDLEVQVVGPA